VIALRLSEVGSVIFGTYGGFSLAFLTGWSRGRGHREQQLALRDGVAGLASARWTTPVTGVVTACSIFIASMTAASPPAWTIVPGSATDTTTPAVGATIAWSAASGWAGAAGPAGP
jgi:hypothetical protein